MNQLEGSAVLIPEVLIYNQLKTIFSVTLKNFKDCSNEKDSFLYLIFGKDRFNQDVQFGKFNFFEQAKTLFIAGQDDDVKRRIEISMGFNLKREGAPTIHILLPSESPVNAGIGDNEGYVKGFSDETKKTYYRVVTQDASVTYNLLITSDNVNEILLIYNFLKASFLGFKLQLELKGLQNIVSGGSDVNMNDDFLPPNLHYRNFTLNFTYDYQSVDLFGNYFGDGIKLEGIAVE